MQNLKINDIINTSPILIIFVEMMTQIYFNSIDIV